MPDVENTLEIISMVFNNHREQFVDKLSNWSTQAVRNRLRMGAMHNRCPGIFSDGMSKAHKGGMKYAALAGATLTTTPECEIVWRVRVASVCAWCAKPITDVTNWRCAKLF